MASLLKCRRSSFLLDLQVKLLTNEKAIGNLSIWNGTFERRLFQRVECLMDENILHFLQANLQVDPRLIADPISFSILARTEKAQKDSPKCKQIIDEWFPFRLFSRGPLSPSPFIIFAKANSITRDDLNFSSRGPDSTGFTGWPWSGFYQAE